MCATLRTASSSAGVGVLSFDRLAPTSRAMSPNPESEAGFTVSVDAADPRTPVEQTPSKVSCVFPYHMDLFLAG